MNKLIALSAAVFLSLGLTAQTGEISGQVIEEFSGETLPGAYVWIEIDSQIVLGTHTDINGFYTIKPVNPGTYDLKVSYTGYGMIKMPDLEVRSEQIKTVDLALSATMLFAEGEFEVVAAPDDLINMGEATTPSVITGEDLEILAIDPEEAAVLISPGTYQASPGEPIQFRGARPGGTEYMVDGVRVRGALGVPRGSFAEYKVYSGGMPAKYGDATGGIIVITTKSYPF